MFGHAINSKKRGDMGVGYAVAWASSQGFTVSVPLSDSQDYDLIIDTGKRLLKVQVKTTSSRRSDKSSYMVNMKVCGGNRSGTGKVKKFDWTKADALFVLTQDGVKYFIPSYEEMPKTCLLLSKKFDMFKVDV